MEDNNTIENNITTTDERIVLFQNYMDWEGAAGINYKQKIEEKEKGKKEKEKQLKESTSNGVPSRQPRENEGLSVREGAIKVTLAYSTAKRRVNQWNESFNNCEAGFPGSSKKTGAKSKLNDEHTVFIFAKIYEQPTISCSDVTDILCQHFPGLNITSRAQYESVSAWMALGIDFFSECVFIDEAGFNRNMHRSHGWSDIGKACKITVETKGPNLSILGAITTHGVITLSRREVYAPTTKKRKSDDSPAPKKGTTGSDFMDSLNNPYRYLVMDNAAIHRTIDVKDWVTERGFEIIYLPPYSPFLNPIEEFWSKLKDVVNKDPASVRLNSKLSDRIKKASEHIFREDCQAWIKHSLTFWDRCLAGEKGL
ncbi:hypothetical protein INT45_012158 [Circinella minor]|uniref:Tc1-like transposase DDE domain-containing protein n=1 Tax=Circinella minor TaxID=1195481 RepID=A0A8H7SAL7_9FUNG|nr:hypothetical protein INT45_012158 [Circinella minor]